MKYSQQIGVVAALLVIVSCFMPWIEVPRTNKILNGLNGMVNSNITFGTQVKVHAFLCVLSLPLFLIKKVWAKLFNIFFCFVNLGWALKNMILFNSCRSGECPVVKYGLYVLVISSLLLMVMSLLPKLEIKPKN
jgi:hypothetical protein